MKLFSTSCETIFAGWDQPLLARAVEILDQRYASADRLNLSGLLFVLPAAHAAARLAGMLQQHARSRSLKYQSPTIITTGQLPEHLYEPTATLAGEFERTLAWAGVLREMNPADLQPLIPTVPPPEPLSPWLDLASMLRGLHEELAASNLSFADVVNVAETESEQCRWRLLDRIFGRYLKTLARAQLADVHVQRRLAVTEDRCQSDRTLVMIGTSDLSDALTTMLRSLNHEVIAIVASPPSQSNHFDEFGSVVTERWVNHVLPITDEQLLPARDVADQAATVAETLAQYQPRYQTSQITIGVTDPSQVGPVEIELRGCGMATFRSMGWTVSQTAIGRLLDLTTTHLQRQSWQSLAALVRHGDVCKRITEALGTDDASSWLTQFDQLLANHFPMRVDKPLPARARKVYPLAIKAQQWTEAWLEDFRRSDADAPIAVWTQQIRHWLATTYSIDLESFDAADVPDFARVDDDATPQTRTETALVASLRLLNWFESLHADLDVPLSGAAAMEMLSGRMSDARVVDAHSADEIPILGWLDLALDDAPAMTVVGLNHPFVPGATTNDPFLPGSLRTQLRMADNDRRYARDAYAMQLILSTRPDVRFIVGKSGADGSPTPPSRLLAAAEPVAISRRLITLLEDKRVRHPVPHRWDNDVAESNLPIPAFDFSGDDDLVKVMSVTAFRDYLACPYRFYLRHVLNLRPLDDMTGELAANQFGDLIHNSLDRYGDCDDKHETSEKRIYERMLHHLHAYADEHYGSDASSAVAVQVSQAERRLKAVAAQQAERIGQGWVIHKTEESVGPEQNAGIMVDGKLMPVKGRFDRIDHHPQTGRWAILDYKTHGHKPEKKHLKKTDAGETWIDLQLPMYRMMAPFLGITVPPAEVELGYFNISGKDEETKINIANFSESMMEDAVTIIHDCIRGIRARRFAPSDHPVDFDDYGMILQTGVASRMMAVSDPNEFEEAY